MSTVPNGLDILNDICLFLIISYSEQWISLWVVTMICVFYVGIYIMGYCNQYYEIN